MKLINTTNSYSRLVENQLLNTDAKLIKVYSLGRTMVVYTERPNMIEIVLENKHRNIQDAEITQVADELLNEKQREIYTTIKQKGLAEISAKI
ncbi:DUF1827 family protein [Xylocopilactobacillus apis]|uniref:DUF1827 domain-containing protein n=1 Tax=Xylocopilactobacillus apis TaxID=2932183 RepID=A0AAU9DMB0_9LACO|nr:DUF1827 family protein [Xylocopilactobacillus apis]BDR56764.1 hypothetical protein KIMC2_13260 [Xylocopilactobacillus apis]